MCTLYDTVGRVLVEWRGQDVSDRTAPREVAREIVDMVIREVEERGAPLLDLVAAHDAPDED